MLHGRGPGGGGRGGRAAYSARRDGAKGGEKGSADESSGSSSTEKAKMLPDVLGLNAFQSVGSGHSPPGAKHANFLLKHSLLAGAFLFGRNPSTPQESSNV